MRDSLPVDAHLDEIVAAVVGRGAVVVEAEPGAGKTTRVPPALLGAIDPDKSVVVLEPRRLAARTAAERVAHELGEKVGQTVGTIMRFDRRVGPSTRLLYVTEAVLTRWLAREPTLPGVGAVVFDEIHERNLHSDVSLALVQRLRARDRPDLAAIAMSATMDAAHLGAYLGASVIECTGRVFPVDVEHQQRTDRDSLDVRIAKAVRRVCREGLDGHVLVFLPGAREIADALARCEAVARDEDLLLCPLHGSLEPRAQDRALAQSRQRKVILATNIAETSLTIDGVVAVIDSGLAKIASHDRALQRARLATRPISQASATQRAGRAGRTRPGRCIRLYSQGDLQRRATHDTPAIERADLSGVVLLLCSAGVVIAEEPGLGQGWLTPPPPAAIAAADGLLRQLEATDHKGQITSIGKRMATLPLHPRLARVAVEAALREVTSEVLPKLARLVEGERSGQRGVRQLAERLRRETRHWQPTAHGANQELSEEAAQGIAWLCGFPDRVAKRSGGTRDLALADGGRATLPSRLAAHEALGPEGYGVVVESRERPGKTALVQRIHPIELDWLLDGFPDAIDADTRLEFDSERKRVMSIDELGYRGLILEQTRSVATPSDAAAGVLYEAARAAGLHRGSGHPETRAWISRVAFAALHDEVIEPVDETALEDALASLCSIATSFADLASTPLHQVLRANLSRGENNLARRVELLAPNKVRLTAIELAVHYPVHDPPFIESYLQDFFGLRRGPSIAGGRVPVVMRLWAPNGRPIQVTSDLEGFWVRHFPKLRRQLSRRYPKHHWADDPAAAPAIRLKRHLP